MRRILIPFAFALLACACRAQPQQPDFDTGSRPVAQASSALGSLLVAFVADAGREWKAYEGLDGVTWLDVKTEYAVGRFARRGKLMLSGFAVAKLPNGEPGIEADARDGSEGEAGITLGGTEQAVVGINITKFYATADIERMLEQQLDNAEVALIAHDCQSTEEGESNRSFYEIAMGSRRKVYAETVVVAGGKYGPEQTVISFHREHPETRIAQMRCME